MKRERNKLIIGILIGISAIIVFAVLYFFVVRPTINGYVVNGYKQGITDTVYTLMKQASECQPVPVYFGDQNMSLIWIDCLKPK